MTKAQLIDWIPALLITTIAVTLLAAGIVMTTRFALGSNTPAIPRASLPTSAPAPHAHCRQPPVNQTIPGHQIQIRKQDRDRFALALQEFAHRQGGCYRHPNRFLYRLTLPEPAINEILGLDRGNYAEWAASATTGAPNSTASGMRIIDLHAATSHDQPRWMLNAGIPTAAVGLILCVVALAVCGETATTQRRTRKRQPTSAAVKT